MSKSIQLFCAWSGLGTAVIMGVGLLLAGVMPVPLASNSSPAEVVDFYSGGAHVAAGLVMASLGICLMLPVVALISIFMARMEGRTPILALIQLIAGALTVVLNILPMLLMATATFRPDRDADLTVLLNDFAWLLFVSPIGPFVVQNIAIGTAILRDTRGIFPRWVGYLNYWVALMFAPDVLAYFFKAGPFAWRGFFIIYMGLVAYGAFVITMTFVLRNAVRDQDDDEEPVDAALEDGPSTAEHPETGWAGGDFASGRPMKTAVSLT